MSSERQFAAIMFTDIVGYTALMGKDQRLAFALLQKNRELQKPVIEAFNGQWIKEIGDGVLASFDNVSNAVNATIRIQEECNAAKDLQLRIGIHLREVVFENNDVFGDGVNVASRIEAMGIPGSVLISKSVRDPSKNDPTSINLKTFTSPFPAPFFRFWEHSGRWLFTPNRFWAETSSVMRTVATIRFSR